MNPSEIGSANVVVIGGGIVGCSIAYHLTKLGIADVVLLEQGQLSGGTTWHAAGLMVTFGSLSSTSTWMRQHSKELYSRVLEEETGMSTGFAPVGFIELAADRDRLEEHFFHRLVEFRLFRVTGYDFGVNCITGAHRHTFYHPEVCCDALMQSLSNGCP